jgi:hypothetical protein
MVKPNKILVFALVLTLLSSCYAANLVYSITLKYDGTSLTKEKVQLIEGSAPERVDQPESGYTLKVIDVNSNILYSFKFLIETNPLTEPPANIFDEKGNQIAIPESTSNIQTTEIALVIPYFENAKSMNIFDPNDKLLLSIDISKYSKSEPDDSFIIVAVIVIAGVATIILFMKNRSKRIPIKADKRSKK